MDTKVIDVGKVGHVETDGEAASLSHPGSKRFLNLLGDLYTGKPFSRHSIMGGRGSCRKNMEKYDQMR